MQNQAALTNFTQQNKEKEKELRIAAAEDDIQKVRELLKAGISTESSSSNGNTALDWSIIKYKEEKAVNYWQIVLLLIAYGAKYHKEKYVDSPMLKDDQGEMETFLSMQERAPSYFKFLLTNYSGEKIKIKEANPKLEVIIHLKMAYMLFTTLNKFLKNLSLKITNPIINVLSLGCGHCHELLPLQFIFENQIKYVGIDSDQDSVDYSTQVFANTENLKFINADASNLTALAGNGIEPAAFDIVIIRHPNLVEKFEVFKKIIFNTAPIFLKDNGILYLSFYAADYEIFVERNKTEVVRVTERNELKEITIVNDQYQMVENIFLEKPFVFLSENNLIIKPDQYSPFFQSTQNYLKKVAQFRKIYKGVLEKIAAENIREIASSGTQRIAP